MKWFAIFFLVLLFAGCEHELLDIDRISFDSFIEENYQYDCKTLYFREIIADSNHFNYSNPVLDEDELTEIMAIIQLVYNLKIPEHELIFEENNIHALPCFSFQSIVMKVDTEAPEIINLANGTIPTGNDFLDDILLAYDFDSVRLSYSYPRFPWLSVNTDEYYNLLPIIKSLEEIPSIIMAENNGGCFDGNNIALSRNRNKATISFSIGWGDCPAGCISRRTWEFEITNNKARFIKSYDN